jgi:hypothetical protein
MNQIPIYALVALLCFTYCFNVYSQPSDVIWTQTIAGNGYIDARTILCDSNNSIWISGVTDAIEQDLYIMKLNSEGDSLWSHTFEQSGEHGGGFLCQTRNGEFVLASYGPIGTGNDQIRLIRIEPTGEIIWERTYGTHNSEEVEAVIEASNGDIVVAGSRGSTPLLFRTNSAGDSVWMQFYPSLSLGWFNDVVQVSSGEFIVTGEIVFGENTQLLVVRIDSLGNLLESENYGGEGYEMGYAISGSEDDGFLFTGRSDSYSDNG